MKEILAAVLLVLFLAGCSLNSSRLPGISEESEPSTNAENTRVSQSPGLRLPGEEHDRTTDIWSSSFENQEEKLTFLGEYLIMPSEIIDAEYHIVYHDNSGGLIPGPSDWDIIAALKVAPEDIPLWTDGMKRLVEGQIDIDFWDELKTEWLTLEERKWAEYWKRPDSNVYLVVYPESGVLLKIASTMYRLKPAEITYEDEVSGFDKYKTFVAEILNYDVSAIPYIMTRQAETALLSPGSASKVMVFEVFIYGGPVYNIPVIVIDTDGDIICEVLIEFSYYTEFSISDIDGDGYAEILMHHETGGNGGAGSHETDVYKLDGSSLNKLFYYPGYDHAGNRSEFDTGFTLTLTDGWLHTVENKYTGYSLSFVREMTNENPYFDEQGNTRANAEENIIEKSYGVDPFFFIFDPVDVDDDGVYEIMTAQHTYLWGRADGVGTAYTILKWNNASKTMDVIKAGFWPYGDYGNADYQEQWQDYEENWYK